MLTPNTKRNSFQILLTAETTLVEAVIAMGRSKIGKETDVKSRVPSNATGKKYTAGREDVFSQLCFFFWNLQATCTLPCYAASELCQSCVFDMLYTWFGF